MSYRSVLYVVYATQQLPNAHAQRYASRYGRALSWPDRSPGAGGGLYILRRANPMIVGL